MQLRFFFSIDCEEKHRRHGIKCLNCNKYITICGARENQETAISKHVCEEKKCSDCYEMYIDSNHICSMKKQTPQKDWNKVSFFSFSFFKNEFHQNVPAQACFGYEK